MGEIVNRAQLAKLVGVAVPTVDRWLQCGMPAVAKPAAKGGAGWKIDVGAVLEWHKDQVRQRYTGQEGKVDAKERKMAAEADLAELELAKRRGVTISIDDAVRTWASMVASTKARLRGMGPKLGPIVAVESRAAHCQALIERVIDEALGELSGWIPDAPGSMGGATSGVDEDGLAAVATAAEADS